MAAAPMPLAQKPSLVRANMLRCFQAGLVPSVTASPGIGKSDVTRSIAKEYNLKLIDVRLSTCDVTDLTGLPFRDENGKAGFLPFDMFPIEGDDLPIKTDVDGNTIMVKADANTPKKWIDANGMTAARYDGWLVFFDEVTSADKQKQAASYKIILDKLVGNKRLHKRVMMACAGNESTDNAVVYAMSTALQSRLIHLQMKVDHTEWMTWGIANGIDSRVLAFLEFAPDNLYIFNPNHQDKTFACPRTWEFASKLVVNQEVTNADFQLIAGTVSAGPALAFVQFAQIYQDLPKLADIVANPHGAPVPNEPSTKYAIATHLADKIDQKNCTPIAKYLRRLPVESRVLAMRMVNVRQPRLTREPEVMALLQEISALMPA